MTFLFKGHAIALAALKTAWAEIIRASNEMRVLSELGLEDDEEHIDARAETDEALAATARVIKTLNEMTKGN